MSQFFLDPLKLFEGAQIETSTTPHREVAAREPSLSNIIPGAMDETSAFHRVGFKPGSRVRQIWAVGGGKGGVGKSLISSSISIALARQGHEVCTVDLDLGAANIHTMMGVDMPKQTLGDYITGRVSRLEDCAVKTTIPRLRLISGAQDSVGMANMPAEHKWKILEGLRDIDADFIVMDLGAGTTTNTLDFFIAADLGILTILPEPTSIENAYRFIKSVYYRRLKIAKGLGTLKPIIEAAMDAKNARGIRTPSDLFREVSRQHPELATRLKEEIEKFRPKLIVNQTRTQADIEIGFSIKSVCKKYFGIEMDYLGYLDYDNSVWQSIRRKRPVFLEFPNSKIVSSIDRIVQFVVKRYGHVRNL